MSNDDAPVYTPVALREKTFHISLIHFLGMVILQSVRFVKCYTGSPGGDLLDRRVRVHMRNIQEKFGGKPRPWKGNACFRTVNTEWRTICIDILYIVL